MSFVINIFVILLATRTVSNSGVFRFSADAWVGKNIYFFYLEDSKDKVQCLRACYEEKNCAAVTYWEEDGLCWLFENGRDTYLGDVYVLSREQTDSACTTETATLDVQFQKIEIQSNASEEHCNNCRVPDLAVIQPYENNGYRFFLQAQTAHSIGGIISQPRLYLSKKAVETCTSVPVFHKANHHRLYFGEIYNTTGYYFYNAYAFADYCVSPLGDCLGTEKIQEYKDKNGNYFYDKPGLAEMENADSGLGQTFFIACLFRE